MPTLLSSAFRAGSLRACALAGLLLLAAPGLRAAPAAGVVADNPYAAEVPVTDDSSQSRDSGLRQALTQVLLRVVGRADPAIAPLLARAPQLVQQYAFRQDPATGAYSLRAVFDQPGVEEALKSQGLPVFGVSADVVEGWVVTVRGVHSPSDYARVMDYFGGIRGVRRVDLQELRDDALQLRMVVEGGVSRVTQLAGAGGPLRAEGPDRYVFVR